MKHLIIINDQLYGSEKPYNAIRLAIQLQKDFPGNEVRIFLMADASACALKDQKTPGGYYNIERMLRLVLNNGAKIRICTSCADTRGIKPESIIEGTAMSTMSELASWYTDADKVISF